MKKLLTLISLCGASFCQIYAQEDLTTTYNNWQTLGQTTVPSPTVAGLAKFTDVPVSYYTGSPNITIPLYTINTGKITWPITLDYNSSGIRVNENSGNVGLEWNIHAEGAIMQTVLGIKDNSSYQTDGLAYTPELLQPTNPTIAGLMQILSFNHTDGVPDIYMYNFGSYSGKFILANDIKTMPKKNLVISSYLDNNSQKCWKIIAEDGKVYIFSAMEKIVNRSASGAPESNNWLLTKVTDPNGIDSLVFQYEDTYLETDIAKDYVLDSYRDTFNVNWSVNMQPNDPPIPGHLTLYSQRNIGKQLKRILFNNGSVEYDVAYNDRQDLSGYLATTDFHVPRVKNIFIKDINGAVVKTIHFEQDYYITPGSTTLDGKRLRLASVSFVPHLEDLNTPVEEKYTFQYNSINLPLKSSNSMDHWGYFNNQDNRTLIPTTHIVNSMTYYGANREPDPYNVMAGMLEHITYPTGGSANFGWECHRANSPGGAPVLVHVDSNINVQLSSTHNDNSLSHLTSDEFTIPDNDSFNNLDVTFDVSAGYPVNANSQTITHAASKGKVYRDDGGAATIVAVLSFAYNSAGNYESSESVTLERGKTYFVSTETTGPVGCSVHAKLTIGWPKIGSTGGGGLYYVGGCRIHSITMHDQTGSPDLIKTYTYPDVAVYGKPVYYTKFYEFFQQAIDENDPGPNGACLFTQRLGYMLSSSSFTNIGAAGNHVGYSYVTENNGLTGGSTTYSFTSFEYGFPSEIDASWRRGLLTGVKTYDNTGTLVKETINHNKRVTAESYAGHTVRDMGSHPCYSSAAAPSSYPSHFDQKIYYFPIDWMYLDTVEDIDYVTGVHSLTVDNYDNSQHLELTRHTAFNSDGSKITTYLKYPTDFTVSSTPYYSSVDGIKLMQDKHMHSSPIEMYVQKLLPSTTVPVTISAKINNFKRAPIAYMNVPDRVILESQSSIDINSDGVSNFQPLSITNNVLSQDPGYTEKTLAKEYDDEGNVWELITNKSKSIGAIYGYRDGLKIAEVANNDTTITMAFTSFEYNQPGRWTYGSNGVTSDDHFTGNYCLNLSLNPDLKIIFPSSSWSDLPPVTPNGLGANGRFIVSYWHKNGTVLVNGATQTKTGITANGWTYVEHTIVNPVGPILLTGTGLIDEVKFHKESSLMKSYTYDPLNGMTSFDDESNHIIFYEYDSMGKLSTQKDVYGNILKKNKYQYQGPQ